MMQARGVHIQISVEGLAEAPDQGALALLPRHTSQSTLHNISIKGVGDLIILLC